MKKVLINNWPIVLILISSVLIIWPLLLPGYFSHHDDLQVMRIFEMRKCFSDFQIPCRWVPDMGYGNGFPLFNYYGVFPYYIGAIVSFVLGFIGAAKFLFFIPLVLGGITMFLLGRELVGKWGGITTAILYSFAPYRSLDAYVRGDIDESFALAIIPLVFYFMIRLSKKNSKFNFIFLTLSLGAFLITHNIMIMLFSPLIILFFGFLIFREKFKNFKWFILSFVLAGGLSAFFLLPAFFEKNLVQTDTLTRFDLDFRVHFVTFKQLFLSRFWGYGASVLGPNDTISFQIGWPMLLLPLLGLPAFIYKKKLLPIFLFIIFAFSVFMTHNKSAFIWEKIGILRYTQFPWRFLSISIFSASLLGGYFIGLLKTKWQITLAITIILLTIILNFSYFKPDKFFYNLTDQQKLSGSLWEDQRKAAVTDYLPVGAYAPKEAAPVKPLVKKGKAQVSNFINKSNLWSFDINVQNSTQVEVPVFDFPIWQVYSNGNLIYHDKNNLLKRIQFNLTSGNYHIEGRLKNTPLRTYSNLITLISSVLLLIITYAKPKNKNI